MKSIYKSVSAVLMAATALLWGCKNYLDLKPTNDILAADVYKTGRGYYQVMTKVYGAFALSGNQGPAGQPDIPGGGDEGWSDFVRTFWEVQELPTDEAVIAWGNDAGLLDFHNMNWGADNPFLRRLYARSYYQIVMANEFLRQSTDEAVAGRGIQAGTGDTLTRIKEFREEARFLRAYQHWVLMDLFGSIPIVKEDLVLGKDFPKPNTRQEIFNFVEAELKDLEGKMIAPGIAPNSRANRVAAQALLARLYLNAGVYSGQDRYADAATYAQKVINEGGYTLSPNYRWLFLADNNEAPASNEVILAVAMDGLSTQSFGATNFLIHGASADNTADRNKYGHNSGWQGLRSTKTFFQIFRDSVTNGTITDTTIDKRAMFHFRARQMDVRTLTSFPQGPGIYKWRNVKRDGVSFGKDLSYMDTDYPLFRLAEMYLIYAEAAVRGAGDMGTAQTYINALRTRAAEGSDQPDAVTRMQITDPAFLNLEFIINERARELYWEGHRRTDLIRFNKFTDNYTWTFKGGKDPLAASTAQRGETVMTVDDKYKLYPIPSNELLSNPFLKQNPGY